MQKKRGPLDLAFHALADPSRRSMIERLTRGSATLGELAEPLGMTLSAVNQHLKVLESSGLVTTEKTGRTRVCTLGAQGLRAAETWIAERRVATELTYDRLGAFLSKDAGQ